MPEQYPLNEILNDDERIFKSWISVEDIDRQGDILPIEQLNRIMPVYMKRGGVLMDEHSNRHIGKMLNYERAMHPQTGKPGIIGTFQLFKDTKLDNERWAEVKAGVRTGISFGGRATGKPVIMSNGDVVKILENVEGYEFSLVSRPANQHALITEVNYYAKGDEPITTNTSGAHASSFSEDDKVEFAIKAGANNPYAICNATVGQEDKDKYEKCILQVKERLGVSKDGETEASEQTETKTKGDSPMAEKQIEMKKEEPVAPEVPAQPAPVDEVKVMMEKFMAAQMQLNEKLDKVVELLSAKPEAPAVEEAVVEEKSKSEEAKSDVSKLVAEEVSKTLGNQGTTPRPPQMEVEIVNVNKGQGADFYDLATGKKKLYEYN